MRDSSSFLWPLLSRLSWILCFGLRFKRGFLLIPFPPLDSLLDSGRRREFKRDPYFFFILALLSPKTFPGPKKTYIV